LRPTNDNISLNQVCVLDQPGGEVIKAGDPRFSGALGDIGVASMANMDRGFVSPAFEAWCRVFLEVFDELPATDGGTWRMEEEMTFAGFVQALKRMAAGKAVGAGGLQSEILRTAGTEVQRAMYEACMADLRGGVTPDHWRKVIYVLLIKPPPNDPATVSGRREIALMAQDMKLVMQMVRKASYHRMGGRIARQQMGWMAGYGAVDVALASTLVIQQANRLGGELWLLYIDLATFFPGIPRGCIETAEIFHGLPPEVAALAKLIYGAADEPAGAVVCQYDSEAGLGDRFRNPTGALMGCVLSPAKAKLVLNSIVAAINLVAKGVRLWGYSPEQLQRTWRSIAQLMYADDWIGMFTSKTQMMRAWRMWSTWELISGNKLGIKKGSGGAGARLEASKTVVSGVRYDASGAATAVGDPRLVTARGESVPYIEHDEAYGHLGSKKRADGSDATQWKKVKKGLLVAIARLRKLVEPTPEEFFLVSESLISNLAEYPLQTMYITYEMAEEVERVWRAAYNKKFNRVGTAPAAQLYEMRPGRKHRRHLYAVGLSAVHTAITKSMGDVDDTEQRAAARSAVALELDRWGCMQDPATWTWTHLRQELERELAARACRPLGMAWMLATAVFEEVHDTELALAARRPEDVFTYPQRWAGQVTSEEGGPLRREASHFQPGRTRPLFEPTNRGGAGAPPRAPLLEAGVATVGHMCGSRQHGAAGGSWLTFEEGRARHPRLTGTGAERRAWAHTVQWLQKAGVPTAPSEKPKASWASSAALLPGAAAAGYGGWAGDAEVGVDATKAAALCQQVRRIVSGEQDAIGVGQWVDEIRAAFPGATPAPAVEWNTGDADEAGLERGTRLLFDVTGDGVCEADGGSAWWKEGFQPEGSGRAVGADGYLLNWEEEAGSWARRIWVDADGYTRWTTTGQRITFEEAGRDLPPALQMVVLAREELGAVPVVQDSELGIKWEKRHVNVRETRRALQQMIEWHARVEAEYVFTLDAGVTQVQTASGQKESVTARAYGRHDGEVGGGPLDESGGTTAERKAHSYNGELAAQLDTWREVPPGSRVVVIFDALSPVLAMKKFRRLHARGRQGYYAAAWVEAFATLLQRQCVIVFIWQRSHVGAPINEYADLLAEKAAHWPWVDVPKVPCKFSTLRLLRPERSVRQWGARMADVAVVSRLKETSTHTQFWESGDFGLAPMPRLLEPLAQAVLAGRCQSCDVGRWMGEDARRRARELGCPHGCQVQGRPAEYTWVHVQFECRHTKMRAARRTWEEALRAAARAHQFELEANSIPRQSEQFVQLLQMIDPTSQEGQADLRAAEAQGGDMERHLRRGVGALVATEGVTSDRLMELMQAATVAGIRVQLAGRETASGLEADISRHARVQRRVRGYLEKLRKLVRVGGPSRAAWLRHREARRTAPAHLRVGGQRAWTNSSRIGLLGIAAPATEWKVAELAFRWLAETRRRGSGGQVDRRLQELSERAGRVAEQAGGQAERRREGPKLRKWRKAEQIARQAAALSTYFSTGSLTGQRPGIRRGGEPQSRGSSRVGGVNVGGTAVTNNGNDSAPRGGGNDGGAAAASNGNISMPWYRPGERRGASRSRPRRERRRASRAYERRRDESDESSVRSDSSAGEAGSRSAAASWAWPARPSWAMGERMVQLDIDSEMEADEERERQKVVAVVDGRLPHRGERMKAAAAAAVAARAADAGEQSGRSLGTMGPYIASATGTRLGEVVGKRQATSQGERCLAKAQRLAAEEERGRERRGVLVVWEEGGRDQPVREEDRSMREREENDEVMSIADDEMSTDGGGGEGQGYEEMLVSE
jgi:hypothetical protein